MTYNELKPNVVYRVTKESSDGTFTEGMLIWMSKNGDINSSFGYISPNEADSRLDLVNTLDFEVVEDYNYYILVTNNSESLVKRPYEVVNDGINVFLKPIAVHSNDVVSYHCPLCESLGIPVIVGDGKEWRQKRCSRCGVNLTWD